MHKQFEEIDYCDDGSNDKIITGYNLGQDVDLRVINTLDGHILFTFQGLSDKEFQLSQIEDLVSALQGILKEQRER